MELKVVCDCGQKYKFDVEPVHGSMPFVVNCPSCGVEGTQHANALIAQMPPQPAMVPVMMAASATAPAPVMAAGLVPAPPAAPGGLRINHAPPPPPVPPPIAMAAAAAPRPAARPGVPSTPKYMQTNTATQNNSFLLGVVGALGGAVVAAGLMIGFSMFTGMRFPLLGTVEGAIIGFGARIMYKGTSSTLGAMSAVVAFVTIIGTFLALFDIIGILLSGIISLLIGVGMAFKVAS